MSDQSPPNVPARRMGSCTLVGAGPGDPELLTLKAKAALAKATVVYADDLVDEAVLAYVNPQAFIEKRMIHEVRQGDHVVRLKGGDPFIFVAEAKRCNTCKPPVLRLKWSTALPQTWPL